MLRTPIAVVFAAGLLLTLGVGSAFAHGSTSAPVARPISDQSDCGQQLDEQGDQQTENTDAMCDDSTAGGGSMDQHQTGSSGDTEDQHEPTSSMDSTSQHGQSGDTSGDQSGQTGDNQGDNDHQD